MVKGALLTLSQPERENDILKAQGALRSQSRRDGWEHGQHHASQTRPCHARQPADRRRHHRGGQARLEKGHRRARLTVEAISPANVGLSSTPWGRLRREPATLGRLASCRAARVKDDVTLLDVKGRQLGAG